jgi:putative membrane protein insertion efficiency factor
MKYIMIGIIKLYQIVVSPLFPPSCRFYPTCSSYFIKALNVHGFIRGSFLGTKRILKCNPFFEGGIDNVPEKGYKIFKLNKK